MNYRMIDLYEQFIQEKGLVSEFDAWKEKEVEKYKNVSMTFRLFDNKWWFEFGLEPKQFEVFKEWSETLDNNFEWRVHFNDGWKEGIEQNPRETEVLMTGAQIKELFKALSDRKNPTVNLGNVIIEYEWTEYGPCLEEMIWTNDASDNEADQIGEDFIGLCSDWHYKNHREDHSWIFNIEDK